MILVHPQPFSTRWDPDLPATTAGGALLGPAQSRRRTGRSGHDLVGVSDMGAKIEAAMKKAKKVEAKTLKADTAEVEADAKAAQGDPPATS